MQKLVRINLKDTDYLFKLEHRPLKIEY
jgi:hypothetical protein